MIAIIVVIIFSGCSQNNSTEEVIEFSKRLNNHINRNYSVLLNLLRNKKGITEIYFKSVAITEKLSKDEISQCRVSTNINQLSLPAFNVMMWLHYIGQRLLSRRKTT